MKTTIFLVAAFSLAVYPDWCKDYEAGKDPISKQGFYCQGARIEKLLKEILEKK